MLKLWDAWKACHVRCGELYTAWQDLEEKAHHAGGPTWQLAKVDGVEDGKFCALFHSSYSGDFTTKTVPFRAKDYPLAQQRTAKICADLHAKHDKANKAAKRRVGAHKAEAAHDAESAKERGLNGALPSRSRKVCMGSLFSLPYGCNTVTNMAVGKRTAR